MASLRRQVGIEPALATSHLGRTNNSRRAPRSFPCHRGEPAEMVRATLLVLLGVVTVALFPLVVGTSEQAPPLGCPPLPEQGPADTVSIYVARALDAPGVLCVRVVNGITPAVGLIGGPFWLEKWEENTFRAFSPGGAPVAGVLAGWE